MAGVMVQEFLFSIESLLKSLEDAVIRNENLLAVVENLQTQEEEETDIFQGLNIFLRSVQGSSQKLSLELDSFQTNLKRVVNSINQSEAQQTYFEKQSERLEKRQEQLKFDRQRFEDEVAAFEMELRKSLGKTPCDNSLLLSTCAKSKQNLTLENFRRFLTAEKESVEKLCNAFKKKEEELLDANTTIEMLKQNNEDLLKEINEVRQHSDQMVNKLRENLFQVKKQHLAVTTEMRLAQEEAEKYRNIFGLAEEIKQTSEKFSISSASNEKRGSVSSAKQDSVNTRCDSVNKLSLAPTTKNPATLLHRACTAPVSKARARMMMKQGDIMKFSEALIDENTRLKNDLQNMKQEKAALQKRANEAVSEMQFMKNQLSVTRSGKEELQKQLQKTKQQNQRLEKTLQCQANDLKNIRKQHKQREEEIRWSKISPVSVLGAPNRYYSQPQQHAGSTRNIAVTKWSNS